nr:MAG TPA: hypothetical protein [Caudoviricetes sp.]
MSRRESLLRCAQLNLDLMRLGIEPIWQLHYWIK